VARAAALRHGCGGRIHFANRMGNSMTVNKAHREFHTLDMNSGWETPEGYPPGVQQKILSGALDE
jgi:hypothetical protein